MEKEGKKQLPNRFLESFQPEVFLNVGFPTRIEDDCEVYKFLDSMHDGRLKEYYEHRNMNCAPTYKEFELIKKLAKNIYSFSKSTYGKGIVVKAPMLCSTHILRKINCLGG